MQLGLLFPFVVNLHCLNAKPHLTLEGPYKSPYGIQVFGLIIINSLSSEGVAIRVIPKGIFFSASYFEVIREQ
jgi:hypothetical protein